MAQYMKKRYHERRAIVLKTLGGKCVVCKSTKDLEMDHVDPQKKSFNGTRMSGVSEKRFLEEIKKCQLLCDKHHTRKTVHDIGKKWAKGTHGTLSSYRYCKCSICKKANSDWSRNYKRTRNSTARVASS